jgi:hypothetical protein
VLLQAYRSAVGSVAPSCNLKVSLLAAIGQVESGSLVGVRLDARHRTSILGPVLDGRGFAAIPDTDNGRWDGNTRWDRAMGPMQFLPSTWRTFGVDGDGDGVADPQDVEDATASAAAYLCYGGRDLAQPSVLRSAVLSYNHSAAYERLVLTYQQRFAALGLDRGAQAVGIPSTSMLPEATPVSSLGSGEPFRMQPVGDTSRPPRHRPTSHAPGRHPTRPADQPVRHPTRPATHPTPQPTQQPATPAVTSTTSVTPTVAGSPTGSPTPTGTATPAASATPTASPTPTASATPTASPTPTASATPTASPTPTCIPVEPSAEPSPTPTQPVRTASCPPCPSPGQPTPTPSPTGTPLMCSPEPSPTASASSAP